MPTPTQPSTIPAIASPSPHCRPLDASICRRAAYPDLDETLRELIESNASNLVADLSQCSFIDATTIQVLLKGAGPS